MTVKDIIGEPLIIHDVAKGRELDERVGKLMKEVGLDPNYMNRYPHEFSGGQRQRIGLARTLSLIPRLIIADEPVSALDVSVQAQVLNLLKGLKDEFGLTLLFIAHDLSVVEHVSDRIAVMYVGKIVEMAETEELLHQPLHPYTEALLSAVPPADPDIKSGPHSAARRSAQPGQSAHGLHLPPALQLRQGYLQRVGAGAGRGLPGSFRQLPLCEGTETPRRGSIIVSRSQRILAFLAYLLFVIGWLIVLLFGRRSRVCRLPHEAVDRARSVARRGSGWLGGARLADGLAPVSVSSSGYPRSAS